MVLFINCCPRKESRTKKIADALLEKMSEVVEVNLYEMNLSPVDEKALAKRDELIRSRQFSADEFALSRQFAGADKIVIAAPYWDYSFPSKLKLYLENIYITGIVSVYDEHGRPKGLCRADELIYITTAGGPYVPDFSFGYVSALCKNAFGIPETTLVKAEMLDVDGFNAEEIISDVIKNLSVE